ncbi:hypothetical protein [Marinitenerispora sediminis]|uniref:Luciferase-like domain-containing protein n=1 Tax=Marinitenerispora sediminis TaxID=1931232 RepID=A0A368T3C4_9ACTN|nr:hypothetical protein [Marinitenerispora sediminis]RCV51652.1 hypothetical protein DEF24_22890 [Marinitenerispora sediminis]RCV54433.1 hypothetical protein DEF23_15935 [Marinitenerispora sediminis]RCV55343.1 hypothetical protein DEF28_06040 [Marinitenerispora sediminis]
MAGMDAVYLSQTAAWDALTLAALLGPRVRGSDWEPPALRPIPAIPSHSPPTPSPRSELANYRSILDPQGKAGIVDTVVAGDDAAVAREFRRYADAGVTERVVIPAGGPAERRRTLDLLRETRGEA